MSWPELRGLGAVDADALLDELSIRQHLHPHRSMGQVLAEAQAELGICIESGRRAIEWLRLDAGQSVGRLRRSELIQLARSVHRFWRQSLALKPSQS